jgi:hypothetical protein
MGVWYGVNGEMKVKNTPEVRELVNVLEDNCGEIEVVWDDHKDGTATLSVSGGEQCSYSTAAYLDECLQNFGDHLADPNAAFLFETRCDDDTDEFWVGTDEAVKKAIRNALVENAREAIRKLTPNEWEALSAETMDANFWIDNDAEDDDDEEYDEEEDDELADVDFGDDEDD